MNPELENSGSQPSRLLARRLRIAAVIVFLLGAIAAELVYWLNTRSSDDSAILGDLGENKVQARQLQTLYGNSNVAIQEWVDTLKHHPGQLAALIFAIAVGISIIALFLAHRVSHD